MESAAQPTCFLIADISGYTGYLATVELDHAEDVLSDLLGVIVSALRPFFRLSRIEGDAAFMYATVEEIDGSMLLDMIERCYFGFRRRQRDIRQATTCTCNACRQIPDLDLKFVVHHGPALVQKVAGSRELLGMGAIVIHRLLKNEVVEQLGVSAYALISQDCIDASDIDPAAARHAGAHRGLRSDRRRAGVGVRSGAPLAGGGGTGPDPCRSGGIHPHGVDIHGRAAAGGMGVPHQARATDELAALGDVGGDQRGDRGTSWDRFRQPLHARQGCGRRGDPRLAAVRLRHGSDDPGNPGRPGEGAPHDRTPAERDRYHHQLPVRTGEDRAGASGHGGDRADVRRGAPLGPTESHRPARGRVRVTGRRPGLRTRAGPDRG